VTTENTSKGQPWLYGPAPDLLFGCGVLFLLASVLLTSGGSALFQAIPLAVPILLVAFVSAPHYGATLIRVYDKRADRRAYFVFSVVTTALIVALFGVALIDRWTGSVLATVYLTWAGWHYTGQNYGISMMFLRRRGVDPSGLAGPVLYASFVLSFLLVFLVLHGQQTPVADPSLEIRLIPLAIPEVANRLLVPLVGVAYLATTSVAAGMLVRRANRFADLLPTATLVFVQALWWSIPYAARHFGVFAGVVPLGADFRGGFFTWIALAHAAQYLWIASYYARAAPGWDGQARYYGRVLLAGTAIWTLPAIVFAPRADEFDWNFALLLAAAVNVHHFVLDGAIWKLRHSRIARILIADGLELEAGERKPGLVRSGVWALCAIALVLSILSLADRFYVFPAALQAGRLEAAAASLDRQASLGLADSVNRFRLGRRFEAVGDLAAASTQYELSAKQTPRIEPFRRLVAIYDRTRNAEGFVRSCDGIFELSSVGDSLSKRREAQRRGFPAFRDRCIRLVQGTRPSVMNPLVRYE